MDTVNKAWTQSIAKSQLEDKALQKGVKWEKKPSWQDIAHEPLEVKMWWTRWSNLQKRGEVWC